MPWSAGTFTRTNGVFSGALVWLADKLAGTKITSAHHDTHDEDLADGINNCMAKDGQNAATGNLDMGSFRLTNLGAGTAISDATRIDQLCHYVQLQVVPDDTVLTAGTQKASLRMPYGMVLSAVRASIATTQTSGSLVTVDINKFGGFYTSILATKITIDNGERTSVTAATPPVIESPILGFDVDISVDIDGVGDGTAKGLRITLLGKFS